MENIFNKLEDVKDKINSLEDKKCREVFNSIIDLLSDLSIKAEEAEVKQAALEEYMGYIGEDLTDIQEELFEEVSIDDLYDIEDEYIEINCKKCNKPLFVEKQSLDNNTMIPCPFCNNKAI